MGKKLGVILFVLVIAAVLITGYQAIWGPEATPGTKEVSIEVVIPKEDVNESWSFQTDADFLKDLLMEEEETLGVMLETTDFGTMVVGMNNYRANESQNEFFHISVNGAEAETGVDEIPLTDDATYAFELREW